jgi:hypothetical protein
MILAFSSEDSRKGLVFETNSMTATTITQDGVPLYKVTTSQHGSMTEIRTTGTDTLVARIARKELFPDTVTFPDANGGKAKQVSKWLKAGTGADGL